MVISGVLVGRIEFDRRTEAFFYGDQRKIADGHGQHIRRQIEIKPSILVVADQFGRVLPRSPDANSRMVIVSAELRLVENDPSGYPERSGRKDDLDLPFAFHPPEYFLEGRGAVGRPVVFRSEVQDVVGSASAVVAVFRPGGQAVAAGRDAEKRTQQ